MEEPIFENEFSQDGPVVSSPTKTEEQAAQEAAAAKAAEDAAKAAAAATSQEDTDNDKGAGPSGAEKRIHQLTAQREAERKEKEQERARREEVERELERIKAKPAEPAKPAQELAPPMAPKEPDIDDFPDDYDAFEAAQRQFKEAERVYIKDLAKFELLTELQQRQAAESQRQQQETERQRQRQAEESFNSKLAKAFEDDPELRYAPIFTDQTFPCPPALFQEIKESDAPVELMRYLSEHREESARIAALPPKGIIRELARIEIQLTTKKPPEPKLVSGAPEPIVPLSTSAASLAGELSDDAFFMQEAAKFKL